jgi:mono/diheme cytochrome c family protein
MKYLAAFLLAACFNLAYAQSDTTDNIPTGIDAAMPGDFVGSIDSGAKIFQQRCQTCHGEMGDGSGPRAPFMDPKPRNFRSEYFHTNFNRPRIYITVALGKLGTEMPTWVRELKAQEIADVSEYLFQRFILRSLEKTPQ